MDMGTGGMDMGSGMFSKDNQALARAYWYIIAGVLALLLLIRLVNSGQHWLRLRTSRTSSMQHPTKPTTWYWQAWATLTAVAREISYPQLYVPYKHLSWLTPPPVGRVLVLLGYWAVVVYMMAAGAIVKDVYYWERVGFRNAWVTVAQVPLLYLLAAKTSLVALLAGTSYERLNWLHRWVARTVFLTATVHGFHFWTEWVRADFVQDYLQWMPMVRFGLGAWALLLWMVLTSLRPVRAAAYEVFVAQHVVAAVLFLWLVYLHVPASARYHVWLAVAALGLDRAFRLGRLLWQNTRLLRRPDASRCRGGQRFGHRTQVAAVGASLTVLTIKDVHFRWRAGQHLYLWLPRVGAFETHPFTIASAHPTLLPGTCTCNSIQLVVRAHAGFSRRLHAYAQKTATEGPPGNPKTLTAWVAGPYGRPPRWDVFETLVLVSASTGASFTLPILESVLDAAGEDGDGKRAICTRRVDFLLAARQGDEVGFYVARLHEALAKAAARGVELTVAVAVTGRGQLETISDSLSRPNTASTSTAAVADESKIITTTEKTTADADLGATGGGGCCSNRRRVSRATSSSTDSHIHHSAARPDVAGFLRRAVEATGGETGVVVCGGASLVAEVRTSVAGLSDERAVHKGTGAQGIHLHVEEYCF
ncbi:ferric-chelate reductase [Apiospora kogelbergensis]|uniref:ferric-chelate reductase n=1 Tax=Apiospora kogelbergensis TaxID=1337665 RepID=UPI00312F6B91